MKISERSIRALGQVITGDSRVSPYRSGSQLVRLFNEFGANDVYGSGFPSRWSYAEEKIRSLNGSSRLAGLLRHILDPRDYVHSEFSLHEVVAHLNTFFKPDGYELVPDGGLFSVRETSGQLVAVDTPLPQSDEHGHLFITEQLTKCDKKIADADFDGAITNARSLLEAILVDIEKDLTADPPQYDGDLVRLFKRVQSLLDLEPNRPDIEQPLRQVLSGLVSIVSGMAAMRNKMSDAHVATYRPKKRHARLAVNASKTVVDFLLDVRARKQEERLA